MSIEFIYSLKCPLTKEWIRLDKIEQIDILIVKWKTKISDLMNAVELLRLLKKELGV